MTSAPPILILLAIPVAMVYVFLRTRTTHFVCPTCGRSFKQSYSSYLFAEIFLYRRSGGRRFVTCPYCGTGAMLEPISDARD